MNLLDELTANAYQIDRKSRGERVSFLMEGEEVEESRMEREAAKQQWAQFGKREPAREVILAALREGRARFESDITHVTGLSHPTVIRILRDLRGAGEVEFHHVGNFRMWSRTRAADDPQSHGAPSHSVR